MHKDKFINDKTKQYLIQSDVHQWMLIPFCCHCGLLYSPMFTIELSFVIGQGWWCGERQHFPFTSWAPCLIADTLPLGGLSFFVLCSVVFVFLSPRVSCALCQKGQWAPQLHLGTLGTPVFYNSGDLKQARFLDWCEGEFEGLIDSKFNDVYKTLTSHRENWKL